MPLAALSLPAEHFSPPATETKVLKTIDHKLWTMDETVIFAADYED